MAAAKFGRHAVVERAALPLPAFWFRGGCIRARLEPWASADDAGPPASLTLGIIAAPHAAADVLAVAAQTASLARDVVVALDTTDQAAARALQAALRAEGGRARRIAVLAHPLRGDFAAQRNRIQQAARTAWVLQLDCDERLADGFGAQLPRLVADGEALGWRAIGLTRRNIVDGVMSALYPDVQYRLLRRSVRFTRAVHEYPVLRSHRQSHVHLGAGILHHIAGRRLGVREALYERIRPGAGRPDDTSLLRRPLEAGVLHSG